MPWSSALFLFPYAMSLRSAPRKPLVLVVDDDPDTADILAELLREHGCDVTICEDGPSALEAVRELPAPDLVLLDLELPRMSGRDVLSEMSRDPSISSIPVVVVSAAPDAKCVHATDNIAKSEILDALPRILERIGASPAPIAA